MLKQVNQVKLQNGEDHLACHTDFTFHLLYNKFIVDEHLCQAKWSSSFRSFAWFTYFSIHVRDNSVQVPTYMYMGC